MPPPNRSVGTGPMTLGVTLRFVSVIVALAVAARPRGTTSTASATTIAAVIRIMLFPFLFAASYRLATYIAKLWIHAYLKSTGRFSLYSHIFRHRCTTTW